MSLFDSLDFSGKELVCFTGGGGKTTLMHRLAAYLCRFGPVAVTTTTRMGEEEATKADVLLGENVCDAAREKIAAGSSAFLFRELRDGKYGGFPPQTVASFRSRLGCCVLAEADGARRKPLKGYAEYEPPLPEHFDYQLIVVGADSFLQPMGEDTVARFEIVRSFLGAGEGEMLTPPRLLRLLTSAEMYLKNSPTDTKRILCLNKADLMEPHALKVWVDYLASRLTAFRGIGITGRGMEDSFIRIGRVES